MTALKEINHYPTVLVVEDDATNAFYAKRVLMNLGCDVVCAETGEIGLECLEEARFDIIFLDIHLPGMGGIEFLKRVRAKEAKCPPEHGPVPIHVLTADVMMANREACIQHGATGFMGKPFRPGELKELISGYGFDLRVPV